MSALSIEQQLQEMPKYFPVVVLMQRQPSKVSQWSEFNWQAIGVMAHTSTGATPDVAKLVHDNGEVQNYLYGGFEVNLYVDECEGYYYNLISPVPRCYVIASYGEANIPIPFLVTMSLDDAHAYMETDEEVYAVDVPPELYRWTENFVLMHYVPQKRSKRKRDDWKNQ